MQIDWVSDSTLTELVLLTFAFVLSAVIGFERQYRFKSAGMKTHTLVGLGSAVFTLVSAYGFSNVTSPTVIIDPSRIAAQVVSGIGFLGAGVIFVRRGSISGLTTAASIWMTASIGMACGAGAPLLALMATALYLLVVGVLGRLAQRFFQGPPPDCVLVVRYRPGAGALRNTLSLAAKRGFEALVTETRNVDGTGVEPRYQATIKLHEVSDSDAELLVGELAVLPGVLSARTGTAIID